MRFFAHTAAFAMPTNERVARHRQTIGDHTEEFIASGIAKLLGRKRQRRRFDMRQIELPQRLADSQKTILRSIFAAVPNPRRDEGHFGVFLFMLAGAAVRITKGFPDRVRREGRALRNSAVTSADTANSITPCLEWDVTLD